MTTEQIITITVLLIVAITGYIGSIFNKKIEYRILFSTLILMSFFFTMVLTVALTISNNIYIKIESKCPQYEKVENVYRLK